MKKLLLILTMCVFTLVGYSQTNPRNLQTHEIPFCFEPSKYIKTTINEEINPKISNALYQFVFQKDVNELKPYCNDTLNVFSMSDETKHYQVAVSNLFITFDEYVNMDGRDPQVFYLMDEQGYIFYRLDFTYTEKGEPNTFTVIFGQENNKISTLYVD